MAPPPMPAWLQAQNAAKQQAVQGSAAQDAELGKLPPALVERLLKRGVRLSPAGGAAEPPAVPNQSGGESAEDKAATLATLQAKIKAGLAQVENTAKGVGGSGSAAPASVPAAGNAGPAQWVHGTDPASGYPYWYNTLTGQSTW
eukprot:COSAG02_NODE_22200_length_760_cov_1.012103_1_plen_143_part_01